jgi:LysR family transcriptional activator of mexEF-oprN operon
MNRIDLRQVDLNLLKAFDALERHRSVTRAGQALGLGQPAMSHALARLRELTLDELFVRGASGLQPTPRALQLIGPVRSALSQVEVALYGAPDFQPETAAQDFRIGMSDLVSAEVLPKLARTLSRTAPGVTMSVLNSDRFNAAGLLDGREIDLAIGLFPETAEWHVKEALFEEHHSCVFNPKLVKAKAPISLADFTAYPHILVTLKGDRQGFVDDILGKMGQKRRVLIASPYFLFAGYLLHQLPVIAALPHRYAALCATTSQLTVSPLPFETPRFTVSMMWHRRDQNLPGLKFLLDTLRAAFATKA